MSFNSKTLVVVEMMIDLVIYWLICKLNNTCITKKMTKEMAPSIVLFCEKHYWFKFQVLQHCWKWWYQVIRISYHLFLRNMYVKKILAVWNVSRYGVFSGLNAGKYWPEKNLYLDTFQAVSVYGGLLSIPINVNGDTEKSKLKGKEKKGMTK